MSLEGQHSNQNIFCSSLFFLSFLPSFPCLCSIFFHRFPDNLAHHGYRTTRISQSSRDISIPKARILALVATSTCSNNIILLREAILLLNNNNSNNIILLLLNNSNNHSIQTKKRPLSRSSGLKNPSGTMSGPVSCSYSSMLALLPSLASPSKVTVCHGLMSSFFTMVR